ncbi:MAG: PA2169 family four-helix-bundle protein [Pyrinomonadaceae bacterium]
MINDYEATKPITTDAETSGATTNTNVSNDDVISTLNNLIETCKDGQEGFKQSAEGVKDSNLKTIFYEFEQQRSKFSGELQSLVRELGGDPENSGSTTGALHRGWINIKSAVTGQDEGAILNEAERGEDAAKKAYKDALEQNLPANIASVVQTQYAQVQAAHDKVRDLRDSANGKTSAKSS